MATTTTTVTHPDGTTICTSTVTTDTTSEQHLDDLGSGPIAKCVPHEVLFGDVAGETRAAEGHATISPPIARSDPWFWLRSGKPCYH